MAALPRKTAREYRELSEIILSLFYEWDGVIGGGFWCGFLGFWGWSGVVVGSLEELIVASIPSKGVVLCEEVVVCWFTFVSTSMKAGSLSRCSATHAKAVPHQAAPRVSRLSSSELSPENQHTQFTDSRPNKSHT